MIEQYFYDALISAFIGFAQVIAMGALLVTFAMLTLDAVKMRLQGR